MDKLNKFYKDNYKNFTKTEKKIMAFFIENPKKVITLSALELGKEIGVSDASILRFSKTVGFKKFSDFKDYVASNYHILNPGGRLLEKWGNFNLKNDIMNKVMNTDLENIKKFLLNINFEQIDKVINILNKAKKIYFLGLGSSRSISQFMFWHMKRLNFNTECVNEGGIGLYEGLSHVEKKDVIFMFSFPRFLNDEINALKLAKERGAQIITITSDTFSEISFLSDVNFEVAVENGGFMNSYIVPMELCNIILNCIFEKNKNDIFDELKKNILIKDFLFLPDYE